MVSIRTRSRIDFDLVLRKAAQAFDKNRPTDINGASYFDVVLVLESALEFKPPIPESDRHGVVRRGLRDAVSRGVLTTDGLLESISQEERAYRAGASTVYTIATSISLAPGLAPIAVKIGRARIRVSPDPNRRLAHFQDAKLLGPVPGEFLPPGYSAVSVAIPARTHHEAAEVGLETLDLLRGIWNLAMNRERPPPAHPKVDVAVNRIRLGRVHTVHLPNGALAFNGCFVQNVDDADQYVFSSKDEFAVVRKMERHTRRLLARVPYRAQLSNALSRYARTLDGTDYDSVLFKLWSLLELLTGTANAQYDDTVKRAAFLWADARWAKAVLEHLRGKRNEGIHADSSSEEAQRLAWQLRRFVDGLLIFHLGRAGDFASIDEVNTFLSQPVDHAELDRRASLLRKAKKFRTSL